VSLCPHIHAADSLTEEFKEFTSIQELEGILCAGIEEEWQVKRDGRCVLRIVSKHT
jgi:hypothetical protein